MSFGQPSWIAVHLLGDEAARYVYETRSQTVLFPSTAGPWGGIGGSAITTFEMTLLVRHDAVLVFADGRLLGWHRDPAVTDTLRTVWTDIAGNAQGLRSILLPADTCPIKPAVAAGR